MAGATAVGFRRGFDRRNAPTSQVDPRGVDLGAPGVIELLLTEVGNDLCVSPDRCQGVPDGTVRPSLDGGAGLLKPSMRKSFLHGAGSFPNDVASVSNTSVVPGRPDHIDETGEYRPLYLPYSDLWELSVSYDIVFVPNAYDRGTFAENGFKTQFLTLGRKDGEGPWRIIEIGSGP